MQEVHAMEADRMRRPPGNSTISPVNSGGGLIANCSIGGEQFQTNLSSPS